jgi:hypothetical protein
VPDQLVEKLPALKALSEAPSHDLFVPLLRFLWVEGFC